MPSCLVVQHVEPERPYAIGDALAAAGLDVVLRRVFEGQSLPAGLEDFDAVVVMGGPMSAASDDGFPTRRAEIDLLAEALGEGKAVLGVCLGAQLLATAAGGRVFAGAAGPEVGWGPVRLSDAAQSDPLFSGLPVQLRVLHWHGDTFRRPPGAVHLAGNAAYLEQAFRCGDRAWGLQFHLEVDEPAVAAFLAAFGEDAWAAGTSPAAIGDETPASLAALRPHRGTVLRRFAEAVHGAVGDSPAGRRHGQVDELA